jgi:2,5-dihydroxypyridine 5,6-dioxygenase
MNSTANNKTNVKILAAGDHLLIHCGALDKDETLVLVCDRTTDQIGRIFQERAERLGSKVIRFTIPDFTHHGQEPPAEVAVAMKNADLVAGLTSFSMAHTQARSTACANGTRYLSLPEFSMELLSDPAVHTDFKQRRPLVQRVANSFTKGSKVRVTTTAGTDITMDIFGREGNSCPGCVENPGEMGSPPDIEANVSPIETSAEGVVVVDGSVPCPEVGLLKQPVTLIVTGGKITDFQGPAEITDRIKKLFQKVGSDKAYVLAECGIGLNEKATLSGIMLTDEGAMGCVHFGFGSNHTVGGCNNVSFHLDFVFRQATVTVDEVIIMRENGVLI